jgi:hypothetical protein
MVLKLAELRFLRDCPHQTGRRFLAEKVLERG